jgi:tetratricopeptide (TPR) repeat protein
MALKSAHRRGYLWVWLSAALVFVVACGLVTADWYVAAPPDALQRATFVGRAACLECHADEYHRWEGSHHDHAMELATAESVRADFNDVVFERLGVTTRFFKRGDEFWVNTEGPDGEFHDYQIKYTFGWEPLQQFMVEFPDGRVQVLRESWDTEKQEWFFVPPPDATNERLAPDDPTHWTGIAQNWNTTCAECHSTNLQKNYDLATNEYRTTWSEIDVSCEECHGPASLHIELAQAKSLFWDRRHGTGLHQLKSASNRPQIETCAKCHSRREMVHPEFRPAQNVCDQLRVSTLDQGLYHADGQILDEVYVYGSFVQSKMYHQNVRCTDCHDPHSLQLKFQGNALCAQCHVPGKYDSPAHHHHEVGTPGASCVECHMPSTNYMVVDPRRDHSLRSPRPDLSVSLGTPNACNNCHDKPDEDAQWAADWVEKWYGPTRHDDPHWAPAIAAGRAGEPGGDELLRDVLRRETSPEIVRATAMNLLGGYRTEVARRAIRDALDDGDDMVRTAAVMAVPLESIDEVRKLVVPRLADETRNVRLAAARRMVEVLSQSVDIKHQFEPADRELFAAAREEYERELLMASERAGAHALLSQIAQVDGDLSSAIESLRTAIRLEPYRSGLRTQLATLLQQNVGKNDEVNKLRRDEIDLLKRDVELVPEAAESYFQMGLLHYLLSELADAESALAKAVELSPRSVRYLEGLASLQQLRYEVENVDAHATSALQTLRQLESVDPNYPALREIGLRLLEVQRSRRSQ